MRLLNELDLVRRIKAPYSDITCVPCTSIDLKTARMVMFLKRGTQTIHEKLAFALVAFLGLASPLALSAEKFPVGDKIVTSLSKIAGENITGAKLADGSNVPKETAAEKAKPLIPSATAKRVVEEGILSAAQSTCHMNWEKPYYAFMEVERAKRVWSGKQIAYIGLLHGLTMGMFEGAFKDKGGCSAGLVKPPASD